MVYKLANESDLSILPPMDQKTWDILCEQLRILTYEYGADRDVDHDDGGYVLYATHGTSPDEVKKLFDYTKCQAEYVERTDEDPSVCTALYLLSNEYGVMIVMGIDDSPPEITAELPAETPENVTFNVKEHEND